MYQTSFYKLGDQKKNADIDKRKHKDIWHQNLDKKTEITSNKNCLLEDYLED